MEQEDLMTALDSQAPIADFKAEVQEVVAKSKPKQMTFNYLQLRLIVGIVAFTLPLIVKFRSSTPLTSISASYYTEARDVFVGFLFIIASVFFAYNGYSKPEAWISKIGALAAIFAALSPTACDTCASDMKSYIHGIAAFVLFSCIVYFCLGPFSKAAKDKKDKALQERRQDDANEAQQRLVVYRICGWVSAVCMLAAVAAKFTPVAAGRAMYVTYWAEYVSMWAFGIAWLVAGRVITWVRGAIIFKFEH